MNGDVLTDLPFAELLEGHVRADVPLTVASAPRVVNIDFGVLQVDRERIVGFTEKPAICHRVSMGVYGMARKTLEPYPPGLSFGFDDLVLDLLSRGEQLASYEFNGYWVDIGRPDDYDEINRNFEQLEAILLPQRREGRV